MHEARLQVNRFLLMEVEVGLLVLRVNLLVLLLRFLFHSSGHWGQALLASPAGRSPLLLLNCHHLAASPAVRELLAGHC